MKILLFQSYIYLLLSSPLLSQIYNIKLDVKIAAKSLSTVYSKGIYLDSDFLMQEGEPHKFSLLKQNSPAFGIIKYEKDSFHIRQLREKINYKNEEEFIKDAENDAKDIIKNWRHFYREYYPEVEFDKLRIYPFALRLFFSEPIQNLFTFNFDRNFTHLHGTKNKLRIDYRGIKEEWKIHAYSVLVDALKLLNPSLRSNESWFSPVDALSSIFKVIEPKYFNLPLLGIKLKKSNRIVQNDSEIISLVCDLKRKEIERYNNGNSFVLREKRMGRGENIYFDSFLRKSAFSKRDNYLIFDRIKIILRGEEGAVLFLELNLKKQAVGAVR